MIEWADVRESPDGDPWLVMKHKDGPLDFVPLAAVGGNAELFGYSDAVDAIEAECTYKDLVEAREIDEEFPCDEQYEILKVREAAREAEAQKCNDEKRRIAEHDAAVRRGCSEEERRALAKRVPETPDPRSAKLRGSLAAREALLAISGCEKDSESVLVKAQADARKQIKACHPEGLPTSAARHVALTADETPHSVDGPDSVRQFDHEDRKKLAEALHGHEQDLANARSGLLHMLAGNRIDPLAEAREADRATIDGIREKYKA